jgi:hypothetical protein
MRAMSFIALIAAIVFGAMTMISKDSELGHLLTGQLEMRVEDAIAPHLTFPPKRRSLFYHLTTQEPRFCQYW